MSGEPLKLRRERLSPEHWETLLSCCSGMITREPLTALLRHLAREPLKALLGGGQIVPPVAEVVSPPPPGSLEDVGVVEGRHPPHPDRQQSNLQQVSVSLGSGQRLPELEDLQHVVIWADLQGADDLDHRVVGWEGDVFLLSEVLDGFNPARVVIQGVAEALWQVGRVHLTELGHQFDHGHLDAVDHQGPVILPVAGQRVNLHRDDVLAHVSSLLSPSSALCFHWLHLASTREEISIGEGSGVILAVEVCVHD